MLTHTKQPSNQDIILLIASAGNGNVVLVSNFIREFGNGHFHVGNIDTPFEPAAFECALAHGRINIARLMVQHGANVNATRVGHSMLMHMAIAGNKEAIAFLLENGADARIKSPLQDDAAIMARRNGHKDLAEMIAKKAEEQARAAEAAASGQPEDRPARLLKTSKAHHRFKLKR